MSDDLTIYAIRREAAEMERDAARIRLETARAEAESAKRTIALADAVAASMYNREMGPQA